MSDPASLREVLVQRHPVAWVDHLLASFQPAYFERHAPADVDGHLELLRRLSDDRPVTIASREGAVPGEWILEVAGYDAFQFLSTLCTLISVHGLSIQDARVFTSEVPETPETPPTQRRLSPPRPAPPRVPRPPTGDRPDRRRKLIDIFRLRQIDPAGPAPDWKAFQSELVQLAQMLREGRYERVYHRLLGRFVAVVAQDQGNERELEHLDLLVDPEAAPSATLVRVRCRDSLGLLSITASALSLCGIRIVQADVQTHDGGRVDDTFWVTDRSGRKISSEAGIRELTLSLILIEHFSSRLPRAVNPEAALIHFSRMATDIMARPNWARSFVELDRLEVLDALVRLLGESDFLWEDFLRDQAAVVLPILNRKEEWDRRPDRVVLRRELDAELDLATDTEERRRLIRQFKDREIFRAGLRSILGKSGGSERFADELTEVAEFVMEAALREALLEAGHEPQAPGQAAGHSPSVLCALGKFGGQELGFGSDLELMFVYDPIRADAPEISEYHDEIVRNLRAVLGIRIGGTFELDFRLRPYGKAGPPATSWPTFLGYYQPGGPAWSYERQALIKLRTIAGDAELARRIEAHRDAYVYSGEPFDRDGSRRLREMQRKQLVKPGTINAKYSAGALVDIEYLVQGLQIDHGKDHRPVRSPSTLRAIEALVADGFLNVGHVIVLTAAYRFFRAMIDALRVVHGHGKDLTVPPFDSIEFGQLARRMRYDAPDRLRADLDHHLAAVRRLVDLSLASPG
jgi:glutamate-ammonia-ligase adenylyltransferase